jgi:hypothetical protein
VLLLALSAASYALSKLVAGQRAGCAYLAPAALFFNAVSADVFACSFVRLLAALS